MKRYIIISKKSLLITISFLLAALFLVLIATNGNWFVSTAGQPRTLPIYSVERTDKKISISFDAAWGDAETETLLSILDQHHIKTTFFVVGQWVDQNPETVQKIHQAGHEIQNHSNSHPHLTNLSKEDIANELSECNQKIQDITGVTPTLMRPPYGDYNNAVIEVAKGLNMHTIQWSVDSLDWKDLSAQEITNRVTKAIKPGGIVLFHNAGKHTPEALPGILETLIKDGYEIVPISQLIYQEDYTIDQAGTQKANKASSQ